MFKLHKAYLISGIATGLILLFSFGGTLPDGKLHIVFCDVGQGDGAYIRFPDGRDMVVDGGPNNKIIECLSSHMPFWDRHINLILATHPQKDHIGGLPEVLRRYQVDYVVRSDVGADSDIYGELLGVIKEKKISEKFVMTNETITIGPVVLSALWPNQEQIAIFKRLPLASLQALQGVTLQSPVLGAKSPPDLNDGSVVFWLRYGTFDAIFTGDADTRVEAGYRGAQLAIDGIEVLKVPHHGSKTGMSDAFLDWLKPRLAVISVGKNSYGHPAPEILAKLAQRGIRVKRTDQEGDIEVVSDGKGWQVTNDKK